MNRVNSKSLDLYVQVARDRDLSLDALFEGEGLKLEALPEWVSWESFCTISERFERAVGGPHQLRALASTVLELPRFLRAVNILQLVASPRYLYWANARWGGPSLFPDLDNHFEQLDGDTCQIVITVPEWLQPCPQLFWISAGLFESLPRILGLSDAMVVVDATSRRCSFRITPPPSLTLWSRMRRAMSAIFYARAAIEEMSEQQQSLKRRFTELEQARDLAEQERQAAESARMIAEDALDTRSRLLATMSHELRTPLSGILGFSELLMATGLDDEQRQLGGQVVRSGEAMRGLIDNILDLSSVSSGNLSLHPVSLHLQQITAPLAARFTQQAASQGLQLIFEVTEGADQLKLDADPGRLRQVLDNLLDNALKYTDSGTIHLRVSRGVGGGIRVEVIDSGAGIPVGERQRIFESYTQVDGSFSRRHGGAGLGLAICRSLIQMMGGQIGYTPVEAGGSCFWIELPLPAGSVPTESAPSPVVVKLPITVAPRSWVLVAEDNPINQLLIRRHLTDLGCTFEIAPDGEVAARLYEKGRHDIVLMDCHMPGVDGFEATARIRGLDPTLSSVPIVAVTANASPGDRQRCLDAGMDDYLSKPFSRAQLVAIMSRWLCEEQRQAS